MGNLCSKSANNDNFSTPGRVLGDAGQSQPSSAPVPAKAKITSSTPGRTLGGGGAESAGGREPNDAQSAAARAAEERAAKANKTGGKLSSQLAAQKKQTQNQTLNEGSEQTRLARDADAAAEVRNYN